MKRLNNKGYMLIEIILASALAFGLAYYMLSLTLKVKNRNDDLLIATLMETDKAIISNKIMSKVRKDTGVTEMNSTWVYNDKFYILSDSSLRIYDDTVNVNKYAFIDSSVGIRIENSYNAANDNVLHINIPLRTRANPNDKQYDVDLYYLIKIPSGG